ncbi:hypothetical protein HYU13_04465 [Candidatus Woesearchaeota archaeon]|nr:hypothetical protein [Candidatus Woesearchaeota archaeon]
MVEKNYLTYEEQKLWEYLGNKQVIADGLVNMVFPEMKSAKKNNLLHALYRKGYLRRIKKGSYFNPGMLDSLYLVALAYHEGYIGLSSALKQYNLLEYEDFTIYIMTSNFRKDVAIEGTKYQLKFIPLNRLYAGFYQKSGLWISTVEKTLFDCLLKPKYVGLQNITKALYDADIGWKAFVQLFSLTKSSAVSQRAGYLLELLSRRTGKKVPPFVFSALLRRVKSQVKLTSIPGKSRYSRKWKIEDNVGEEALLGWRQQYGHR